jgi:2-polyprenyl-6-methoxyphenol hydroxylase-like FAD-dependent oxidoreductase
MPDIIVLGGGVGGLAAAVLLARDGHDVTVLERDADPLPGSVDDALQAWPRRGVPQFQQAHYMLPRGRTVLDEHLPDVRDALLAAGARRFDVLGIMPPSIADRAPRPGDERFQTITARRGTIEWVLGRTAAEEPGVEVRRGTEVEALLARRANGTPHVTGVRTAAGDELHADLVVDAMGRRSRLPALLADHGAAPVHEEAEDLGFIYYTRFFRSDDGALPAYRAAPLTPFGTFSLLTLPADNGTWSVTVYISAGDRALKAIRDPQSWSALVRACPTHAHWIDHEPVTEDVLCLGGVVDRYRRYATAEGPVATGVLPLADAWACTNPSLGRGMTLALVHAQLLRDYVRYHLEHPRELAEVWDTVTDAELTPWYRSTVREDRARAEEIDALRAGRTPPPPADPESALLAALPVAAARDADVFRALVDTRSCYATTEDVIARPGMAERIRELTAEPMAPPPGPTRAQVLDLIAA